MTDQSEDLEIVFAPEYENTNVMVRVQPIVDRLVGKHSVAGEGPLWDIGSFMMPGPDGTPAMHSYLTISIASPVIDAPSPSTTAIIDLRVLLDESEADPLIANLLRQARENRSQMLAAMADSADPKYDFSNLT